MTLVTSLEMQTFGQEIQNFVSRDKRLPGYCSEQHYLLHLVSKRGANVSGITLARWPSMAAAPGHDKEQ